jgi:hypothetical protein
MMEFALDIAKHTRLNFIKLIEGLSIEQLNLIPQGFNNNIAWNFAHIVAAQQVICYMRAGVPTRIPEDQVKLYQKGTSPQAFISETELDFYKIKALTLLDDLQTDLAAQVFENYEPITTVFGVTLNSITDAVPYFTAHDNLHLGYAQALKRAVLHQQSLLTTETLLSNQ